MLTPPQHTPDHEPVFIWRQDPAWDMDRIGRETAEQRLSDASWTHPIDHYFSGASRLDLDAVGKVGAEQVTARQYLRGKATEFVLRRLPPATYVDVMAQIRRALDAGDDFPVGSLYLACKEGVRSVRGLDGLQWVHGELTEQSMHVLLDLGLGLVMDLGLAVWQYSQPMRDAEKKV